MKDKKKGIIIALAAFCLAAAIACAVGAVIVKKGADSAKTFQFTTLPDGTDISDIEGVYNSVKSASVKGAPDTFIKAAYIKKVDSGISEFNLIKTYDAFRLYDVVSDDAGVILCVYSGGDKAIITSRDAYKTAKQRAKLISGAIERLDKNYEMLLKQANMDNVKPENILY